MKETKKPSDSAVSTRYVVMPDQANPDGFAFGGIILSWIDMVASMAAQKHCRSSLVTAEIDSVSFIVPIEIGDHVILKASVNYTGKTSMEVGVKVLKENPITGIRKLATRAYLTFVALDENRKPKRVAEIIAETEEEIRRYNAAQERVAHRKKLRNISD